MRDFLDQIENTVDQHIYYVALLSSLSIPDIYGAMEAEDGLATPEGYRSWFEKWVAPRYRGVLSAEDCYMLRCAMLHQGSLQHPRAAYSRVIFIEPGTSQVTAHLNVIGDALNLDVAIFCRDMLDGARAWLGDNEGSENYGRNYERFLKRHPHGLSPYIGGVPVIG